MARSTIVMQINPMGIADKVYVENGDGESCLTLTDSLLTKLNGGKGKGNATTELNDDFYKEPEVNVETQNEVM